MVVARGSSFRAARSAQDASRRGSLEMMLLAGDTFQGAASVRSSEGGAQSIKPLHTSIHIFTRGASNELHCISYPTLHIYIYICRPPEENHMQLYHCSRPSLQLTSAPRENKTKPAPYYHACSLPMLQSAASGQEIYNQLHH